MKQLTKEPIYFSKLDESAHLYQTLYVSSRTAILVGQQGQIGKLSVNMPDLPCKEGEFFVKLYGEGEYFNDPCFQSGLFERIGEPFTQGFGTFEKWRIKEVANDSTFIRYSNKRQSCRQKDSWNK